MGHAATTAVTRVRTHKIINTYANEKFALGWYKMDIFIMMSPTCAVPRVKRERYRAGTGTPPTMDYVIYSWTWVR